MRACTRTACRSSPAAPAPGSPAGRCRSPRAIVIGLAGMNRVLEVDAPNRRVRCSPASSTSTCPGRWRRTGSTTPPIPPASRCARSAATSPRTPAARTASSTASPPTTCRAELVLAGGELVQLGRRRAPARPAGRLRRLGGHARHRHRGAGAGAAAAPGGGDAAGRLRHHRPRRRGGVGDHRRRHHPGRHRDDGRADHRGRRGGGARGAAAGRGRRAAGGAGRPGRRGGGAARPLQRALPGLRRARDSRAGDEAERAGFWPAARRRSRRWAGSAPTTTCRTASSRARGCRRRCAGSPSCPSHGLRVGNVFHAGDGNLHPLVLYDGAVEGEPERAEQLASRS